MNVRIFYMVTFVFAIILAFITPPFIFGQMDFVSRGIRLTFGLLVMLLLISKLTKVTFYDVFVFLSVAALFSIELLWKRSELNNILSYYAVVIFYVLLFIVLRNNEPSRETFLKLWIRMGYFISISAILLFVLHQFTSVDIDFFNFASLGDFSARDLRFSFLGSTQVKNFGFFSVIRSYSYFGEPQYAAFYFTINILLAGEINKSGQYRRWFLLNLLAGFLTFSITFFMAMAIIYMLRLAAQRKGFLYVVIIFSALFVAVPAFIFSEDILTVFFGGINTSYDDRAMRMANALDILNHSAVFDFLFGHGVSYTGGDDRGLSSGFFHVLVERGLTGLLFILSMLAVFVRRNFLNFIICLLFLFALTWYVNYIYWMGILALWVGVSVTKSRVLSVKLS